MAHRLPHAGGSSFDLMLPLQPAISPFHYHAQLSDLPALADLYLVDCHESLWWEPLTGAGSTLRRLHVRRA